MYWETGHVGNLIFWSSVDRACATVQVRYSLEWVCFNTVTIATESRGD